MRLLFWRKSPELTARAAATPYDKWLRYTRWGALAGALLLLLVSLVPLVSDWTAPNQGGDINLTAEFYTAFEGGGALLSWDFSPAAAKVLRERMDAFGDHNGNVTDAEFFAYKAAVEANVRSIVVVRSFEIRGVKVDEQRGLVAEPVNSSTPAYVHVTIGGTWVQQDADIALAKDALVTAAYNGTLQGWERIHERTKIINGGVATFTSYNPSTRGFRVPGGSLLVSTRDYTNGSATGAGSPDAHLVHFSPLDSSLALLAPVIIAYFLGVAGARREQQATRQPRVVPLHDALFSGFLLLLVAYFAGVPGIAIWVGGALFGIGGLMLSYRFYPPERRPEEFALPPAARRRALGDERAEGAPEDAWEPVREPSGPSADVTAAAAMLAKAHGPLDPKVDAKKIPAAPAATISAARDMLPKAVSPLELPDDDTPRPDGRIAPPRSPSAPAPPPKQPPAPAPVAAPSPKTRVRCPGCKHYFEAEGKRPVSITCPHCGRHGVLR